MTLIFSERRRASISRSIVTLLVLSLFVAIAPATIFPKFLSQAQAAGDGLNSYYRNDTTGGDDSDLSSPFTTLACTTEKLTSTAKEWGTGGPTNCNSDNFTGYYTGWILGPKTGTVNFTGGADDVLIVRINGTSVVKKYLSSGSVSGSFNFTAGVAYPIQIWFHEVGGGAGWNLSWDQSGSVANIDSTYLGSTAANLLNSQYLTGNCQVGSSSACPAYSPQEIYNLYGTTTDGNYWIMTGGSPSFQYVLMNRSIDAGAWILGMKATKTSTSFDYEDTYHWQTMSTENASPLENMSTAPARIASDGTGSDGKYEAFSTTYAQRIRAVFPEYAAATYGGRYTTNNNYGFMWDEPLSNLTAGASQDSNYPPSNNALSVSQNCTGISTITLNNLFTNSKRCLFRKPASSYTAGNSNTTSYDPIGNGIFSSQPQFAWWGINYTQPVASGTPGTYHHARFGFGWNENVGNAAGTDEGSNDVTSGIGLFKAASSTGAYPTGSYAGCCQTQTGVQRQMAFEIYLRQADPSLGAPTNLAAIATSSTSVNLTWNAPSGVTATEYVVQYKSNSSSWDSTVTTLRVLAPGASPSAAISGLTAGTVYTFRVFARTVDLATNIYDTNSSATPAYVRFGHEDRGVDSAFTFGGNQFFQSGSEGPFDIASGTTFSLEAWIRPTTLSGSQIIAGKNGQYSLYISNNSIGFNFYTSDVTAGVGGDSPYFGVSSAKVNQWQHVAMTRSGTTFKFYINGSLVTTKTLTPAGSVKDGSSKFMVGGYSAIDQPFSGQIDQVRVWSSERTQSEIIDGMTTYVPSNSSGLIASYGFNEGSGMTVYDTSGQGGTSTDLTLATGSAAWWSVAESSTATPYTTFKFTRSILNTAGGWKVPDSVTVATTIVVGGGGGAGKSTTNTSNPGGAGGGGGVTYSPTQSYTPASFIPIRVGVGGLGAITIANDASSRNGTSSYIGAGAGLTALGGGGGGSNGYVGAGDSTVATGGGGGGNGGGVCTNTGNAGGTVNTGYNGSYGTWGWGGGGGGARGAAANGNCTNNHGSPGAGFVDTISSVEYGRGGYAADYGTSKDIAGVGVANNGWGGVVAYGSLAPASGAGFAGSSGVVIIRFITALKPTYTKPTNAYLNVGMTETFTTNVAVDSATVGLTRTFRWESTTTGSNGTFSLIKQGTGAANAGFSWKPSDTSTSGSNFLYRLIVTDSDTAGLFITDSSTAFAVINKTMTLISKSQITKTVGFTRLETFTVANGTPTFTYSLSPPNPFFWVDTATALTPRIRIADTATVGTYYETFTVTDSVSASISVPLTIIISAPPSFSAASEQVDSSTVLLLDAGNTASYPGTGTTVADISGRALSADLTWAAGTTAINAAGTTRTSTSALNNTTCSAPTYSRDGNGSLVFDGSTTCGYVRNVGYLTTYTYEVWIKPNGIQTTNAGIIVNPNRLTGDQMNFLLTYNSSTTIMASIYNGSAMSSTSGISLPSQVWSHVAVTYDGNTLSLIVNGETTTTVVQAVTWNPAIIDYGVLIGRKYNDTINFKGSIASLRFYSRPIAISEIRQNFYATKNRFTGTLNENTVAQKYASRFVDTYTVTAGSESITATFTTNALSGIKWDTTTARSLVLTLQDTLTPGTYYDTITATDIYGSTSKLPLIFNIAKADSLTITMDTATVITYNGIALTSYPRPTVKGLKGSDSATTISRFSSSLYADTRAAPVNADTYTVRGETPTFTIGSLSYYEGVIYETSTATINRARQQSLSIFMYGGAVGSPFLIYPQGGNGTGAVTETLTGIASLTGCAINSHYLTAAEQKQGFCEVRVVKAGDQNYFSETQTVQLYFMAFVNSQPTGLVGSGSTIALNGKTSLTIDDSSTVRAPRITGFYIDIYGMVIYGEGFGSSPVTVVFERYQTTTGITALGGTAISVTTPANAVSGPVLVITSGGRDSIDWVDIPRQTPG